jgi:plasmid maintenance system antidote protein VapI
VIAKAIGLDQATISRFMSGKGGLALETVDKLTALLGLRLRKEPKVG